MLTQTLANRIKERRKSLSWSQKDLAKQVGMTQGAIAQFESGQRTPSLESLPHIARALGVSTDYLIVGEVSDLVNVGSLNAADRLLVRRFCEFLAWSAGVGK